MLPSYSFTHCWKFALVSVVDAVETAAKMTEYFAPGLADESGEAAVLQLWVLKTSQHSTRLAGPPLNNICAFPASPQDGRDPLIHRVELLRPDCTGSRH